MTQLNALSPTFYRHSGRFSPGGLALAIIATFASALILGAIYGVLGFWIQMIPAAKLSFILLLLAIFGLSISLGTIASRLCKSGHVRNTPLALLIAGSAGALALYAAWVFWIYTLFFGNRHVPPLSFLAWPPNLWAVMEFVNARGVWAISGKELISGVALWIFWAAEAATILVTIAVTTRKAMNAVPYCETCQKWGAKRLLTQARTIHAADLTAACLRKDFTPLSQAAPFTSTATQWFDLFLEGCADCDTLQCLTLEEVTQTFDKKGNAITKRKTLLRRLLLAPEDTIALAQAAAAMKTREAPPS